MAFQGAKKLIKKDPLQLAVVKTPPALTGGVFFFGKIKAGKTTAMMSFAQKYHDHPSTPYKILDLWGGERSEQMYWTLPSRYDSLWKIIRKKLRFDQDVPKQYKVNLLIPYTRSMPDKLPHFPPYVFSKVFTIPYKNIEIRDIELVKGLLTNKDEYVWREIRERCGPSDDGPRLLKLAERLKATNLSIYQNFMFPLVRERLLQSDKCEFNLNLEEELGDRETITVLVLNYLDPEFQLFVMGYILRNVSILLDKGRIPRRNIVMIREASKFFKAEAAITIPDRNRIFKEHLKDYIRMGRRGVHLFLDTQSPSETRGFLSGSEDMTIIGKIPSSAEEDRAFITESLYKDNLMTKAEITQLGYLEPGEYFFAESGKRVKKRYMLLPRSDHWREGDGDFFEKVWKSRVNKWISVEDEKERIETRFKESERRVKDEDSVEEALNDTAPAALEEESVAETDDEPEAEVIIISPPKARKPKKTSRKKAPKIEVPLTSTDLYSRYGRSPDLSGS